MLYKVITLVIKYTNNIHVNVIQKENVMTNLVLISNRLPVTVSKDENGQLQYQESIGGLATGLKHYHEQGESVWIGWPGISSDELSEEEKTTITETLNNKYNCQPVFLSESELEEYYLGFCNETIWPLFHYFTDKVEYSSTNRKTYKAVNQKFSEATMSFIKKDSLIWVHDYQLMLLPKMLRVEFPHHKIGFFLHIPFPSYEIFRLLNSREELLEGILGADLIGFHTYDYVRHFISSAQRLLKLDSNLNTLNYNSRTVKVDAFPMGVDYEYFAKDRSIDNDNQNNFLEFSNEELNEIQIITSVDRLDYTKGIPSKIKSLTLLLEQHPEYIGKIRFNLIVSPSRTTVDSYDYLRKEITELVSEVNGKYATGDWLPIWYYYRSFSQEELISLYKITDVMLVTPLRDGMNLVAKEYISSNVDDEGMLVISETAGAASECGEAVIVNPNDYQEVADGMQTALEMPLEEQHQRNNIMRQRMKRNNVTKWADSFIDSLETLQTQTQHTQNAEPLTNHLEKFYSDYDHSKQRIFFLDYDGTLVNIKKYPKLAKPDADLRHLLTALSDDQKNKIVIVSGRDATTLDSWLGDLNVSLVAEHGLVIKEDGKEWRQILSISNGWKKIVSPIMETYQDRMPGTSLEEKDNSLAFHYRNSDPYLLDYKLSELRAELSSITASENLTILNGRKVIEVKDNRVNKGVASNLFLQRKDYDFIFAAGDDTTDEDLFQELTEESYSVKVGTQQSSAQYTLNNPQTLRRVLSDLTNRV